MATLRAYLANARQIQEAVARKLGTDITSQPKHARVLSTSVMVIVCALVKLLVDKGVITDQELQGVLDSAQGDSYPDEPVLP